LSDQAHDPIEERLARLEAQVAAISRALGTYKVDQSGEPDAPVREPQRVPAPAMTQRQEPVALPFPGPDLRQSAPASAKRPMDFETLFGGRVLLGVGALILLLGIGFFIKYAFDNGWIGPTGRVAIGLIAGVAFVGAGRRFAGGDRRVFADAMTGLGGAILYLSLWGAGNGFHLVPVAASFVAMAIVTASLIALAVRGDSEVTAAFAVVGGFVTPLLNASETPDFTSLFVYIAILDSALAFLPVNRRWPRIQAASFFCTQFYLLAALFNPVATAPPLASVLVFATVVLGLFLAQPLRKASRGVALSGYEAGFVVIASAAYYYALHVELYAEHRHWLTAAVVALAAAYLALAQVARSRDRDIFAAIALALITGGVAITFTGNVVAILWSIEGALLVWVGLRQARSTIRIFGCIALALGTLDGFAESALYFGPHGRPFFNQHFLTLAVVAAAYFIVRYAWLRAPDTTGIPEKPLYALAEPTGHFVALVAMSIEIEHALPGNTLWLTIFWLVYAAGLFAFGFARTYAMARWEAFALLTLAILKAFLIDMSEVNPGVRIISFVTLGCVLLAVSYASQRFSRPASQAAAPAELP
jgi:uncharacterized membrane protein